MLAWLVRESWSTLRLMSCTPWQLLQDGATINPICSKARPWMLSRYCAAAWELVMRYSSVRLLLLWQFAQVCGRFSLKTGESICFTGTISCAPWQLVQVAAPEAPMAWLMPWMLVA